MQLATARRIIEKTIQPCHFFVGSNLQLQWNHVERETIPWELFQGRLLDRRHTRAERTFEAWHIHQIDDGGLSEEPLLAVKLDPEAGEIHVTRGILCYVQEGYHAGDNVYLTRETTRWTRELVATIALEIADESSLRTRLAAALSEAVVGQSRLPLTSLESPLPGFLLGQLGHFPMTASLTPGEPWGSTDELIDLMRRQGDSPQALRVLELLLRSIDRERLPALADSLLPDRALPLMARVLNDVALSPWTTFVERSLQFLQVLEESGKVSRASRVDFLCRHLRLLTRHLTAYDLMTFHYRGANYPDALLLDALLKELIGLIGKDASLFLDGGRETASVVRRRRTALRQAWLVRRFYEGHLVPDAPTSPGELQRVLPPPFVRVPEEQLLNVMKRKRQLYAGDFLPREPAGMLKEVLQRARQDLIDPVSLRELGLALFIDRPFGAFKAPAEPDRTPLLSYLAFSPSLARRRLQALIQEPALLPDRALNEQLFSALDALPLSGLDVRTIPDEGRPVVSLADARKVAEDFHILRSFGKPLQAWLNARAGLAPNHASLIVRGPAQSDQGTAEVRVYDDQGRQRLALAFRRDRGYTVHPTWNVELPSEPWEDRRYSPASQPDENCLKSS